MDQWTCSVPVADQNRDSSWWPCKGAAMTPFSFGRAVFLSGRPELSNS